jgi:hypothetical protein
VAISTLINEIVAVLGGSAGADRHGLVDESGVLNLTSPEAAPTQVQSLGTSRTSLMIPSYPALQSVPRMRARHAKLC